MLYFLVVGVKFICIRVLLAQIVLIYCILNFTPMKICYFKHHRRDTLLDIRTGKPVPLGYSDDHREENRNYYPVRLYIVVLVVKVKMVLQSVPSFEMLVCIGLMVDVSEKYELWWNKRFGTSDYSTTTKRERPVFRVIH